MAAHRSGRTRLAAVVAAGSLVLLGCGGDDPAAQGTSSAAASSSTTTTATAPGASEGSSTTAPGPLAGVPDTPVRLLSTGEELALSSLTTAGRPTLLWFWAPHCVFCRAEAPDLVAFAAEHGDRIDVVGVGAQDDLGEAEGFLADTGTGGLTMVWDRTGRSWVDYGVTNQPTIVVLDGDGEVTGTWFREFAVDELLAAAGTT